MKMVLHSAVENKDTRKGSTFHSKIFWAKLIRFGSICLDLDKIKILHTLKHPVSYDDGLRKNKIAIPKNSPYFIMVFLESARRESLASNPPRTGSGGLDQSNR